MASLEDYAPWGFVAIRRSFVGNITRWQYTKGEVYTVAEPITSYSRLRIALPGREKLVPIADSEAVLRTLADGGDYVIDMECVWAKDAAALTRLRLMGVV